MKKKQTISITQAKFKKTVLELTYGKIEPKQGAPSKFADSIRD